MKKLLLTHPHRKSCTTCWPAAFHFDFDLIRVSWLVALQGAWTDMDHNWGSRYPFAEQKTGDHGMVPGAVYQLDGLVPAL